MNTDIQFKGDFYAQSPEEFKRIKIAALKAGYKAKEMTSHPENKATGRGQFLTLEAPRYERKGKCGYCGSLIDVRGIYAHGRKCECCGKTIYQKYEKGGLITFYFRNFTEGAFNGLFSDVTLRIHSFDVDQHILRFEMAIPRSAKYGKQSRKRVLEIMEKNRDAYNIITIGKKKVYSFYYPFTGMMNELTRINTSEVRNRKGGFPSGPRNVSVVQILDGKEYSEHASYGGMFSEDFPMPTSFHLYRDWKVEKTIHEICRRAGLNSRPEYYSGRPAGDITETHLIKLYNLIKDFKGQSAADNFVEMVKGTNNMAATIFVKRLLKLDQLKYVWDKSQDEIKESKVELDGNPLQGIATVMSMMQHSGGLYGLMGMEVGEGVTMGDVWDSMKANAESIQSASIKGQFLNSINK